jgi:hypothetical protein
MGKLRFAVILLAVLAPSVSDAAGEDPATPGSFWRPYARRFALVVMAGNVEGREPHYGWYWTDTHCMVRELVDREGFAPEDVFFLAYGPRAKEHGDLVRGPSTTAKIRETLHHLAKVAGKDDLVYLYWVDHGSPSVFATYDGHIRHVEVGGLIRSIRCRTFVGAFNPCNSGALIDDVRSKRAVILTSTLPTEANSWGWAGQWRVALAGGDRKGTSDVDGDGRVSLAEAYAFTAARANRAGEHPLIDDDGDGRPGCLGKDTYDPTDRRKDGFRAAGITLSARRDSMPGEPEWPISVAGRGVGSKDPIELLITIGRREGLGGTGERIQAPCLLFCHSKETAEACRETRARLFRLPAAVRTPVHAVAFRTSRVDVSGVEPGASPHVDRTRCPAVIVVDAQGRIADVLTGTKLRDRKVAAALKKVLDPEVARALKAAANRMASEVRALGRLAKKRDAAAAAVARAYGTETLAAKLAALREADAAYAAKVDALVESFEALRDG